MVEPLFDRVLIKPDELEERSQYGIIIPDTGKTKWRRGTVVGAGPGIKTHAGFFKKTTVKPGDIVWYEQYGPTEVQYDGQTLVTTKESFILMIEEV